ncbi:MAG: methyltransferase domain-containing protein [Planctomycetes bacterium]|nr:methyltransferase domain-containing protein [Planctomycetota bacterium]
MADFYPRLLETHGPAGTGLEEPYASFEDAPGSSVPVTGLPVSGPHYPLEFARRLFAQESLHPFFSSAHTGGEGEVEPYSLQWFLNIENQRHSKHGRWIPRLLEFAKHSGETLLGLGHGLGTDWVQYARHGADVIICTPSMPQLQLIRRNFELRGLLGRFIHARPVSLPLETASIDVACISSLDAAAGDLRPLVYEVYRVLKPGGKVLAVTRSRRDVDYWSTMLLYWYRAFLPTRTHATPRRLSGAELCQLFDGFIDHRVHKRQLRRSEVPHVWRWLPLPLLARLMGRFLILKALKPLSAALPWQTQAA